MFHIWEFNDSIVTYRKSYAKIFWWHILAPNLVSLQPNCDQAEIRLHALLLIYVTRFLKARAVKRELYQIMWQCVSAWRKLDVTTLLYWRVRAGSDWRPALSACQTHPKSLEDKGAVPLTFWEMPCMTTSKSYSKSAPSASCSKKPFPFKGCMRVTNQRAV